MPNGNHEHSKCVAEICDRPAEIGDLCSRCYNYLYRWTRRNGGSTPTQVIERRKTIARWDSLLEMATPNVAVRRRRPEPTKVVRQKRA